jgi:8-hydroxy-5-deazaflavin:NADPH oxidoreductase
MNIGIIGSGEMGLCLAVKLKKLGHNVVIANSRGPASLKTVTEDTGLKAFTVEEAIKNQQVIIISIPQKNIPNLPKSLFKALSTDVAVVDTGNYYPLLRDGEIADLNKGGIDSLWVQEQLGVVITKAFNSILATSMESESFNNQKGNDNRIALPISGDSAEAKIVVCRLVKELGFDVIDLGGIDQSWKQQPGSPIYCRDLNLNEMKSRLALLQCGTPDTILARRKADQALMKADYTAYLKKLQVD